MKQEWIVVGASVPFNVLQWLEDYRKKSNATMSRIFQDAVEEYLESRLGQTRDI